MTKKTYLILSVSLVHFSLSAEVEHCAHTPFLKDEFNIVSQWHTDMSWHEFLDIRKRLKRKDLVKYVDKIEQQKLALTMGIAIPQTFIASREKIPVIHLLSTLDSYVVKMTHLSLSKGILFVKDGIDQLTGMPVTPEYVQKHIYQALALKPRKKESWALHQVKPGFMIQEYIPSKQEVKIQTVWGKAIIGEWRRGGRSQKTTPVWGKYTRAGKRVMGDHTVPTWWPQAIAAAEKIAAGTDALRVDFLVRPDGTLLLNELEIWPESDWSCMIHSLEKALHKGYHKLCKHTDS